MRYNFDEIIDRKGTGGENYMQMNLACPRSVVEKALKSILKAVVDQRSKKLCGYVDFQNLSA